MPGHGVLTGAVQPQNRYQLQPPGQQREHTIKVNQFRAICYEFKFLKCTKNALIEHTFGLDIVHDDWFKKNSNLMLIF